MQVLKRSQYHADDASDDFVIALHDSTRTEVCVSVCVCVGAETEVVQKMN